MAPARDEYSRELLRPGLVSPGDRPEYAAKVGLVKTKLYRFPLDREDDSEGTLVEVWVPTDDKRCVALTRSGYYRGSRCIKWRVRGTRVCLRHGAQLPNVRKHALKNLIMASDDAVSELIRLALLKKDAADGDKLKAIGQILDRAGVGNKQEIEVTTKPWQDMLAKLAGDEGEAEPSEVDDSSDDYDEDEEASSSDGGAVVMVDYCETCGKLINDEFPTKETCKCEVDEPEPTNVRPIKKKGRKR